MTATTQSPGLGRNAVRAALWSCGTLASLSIMAVAGREAAALVPTSHVMLHRGWIGGVIVVLVVLMTGQGTRVLATQRLGLHCWRNAAHFTAQYLWFWSLTQIPLADVFALEMTIPLWLAILSPMLLGERLTLARSAAIVLGFAGALIVIRPAGAGISLGAAAALGCAVGFALSVVAVKKLTSTDGPLALLFWMCVIQTAYGVIVGWQQLAVPPAHAMGWLVAVALCGLGTHYCMARAIALADTLLVAPMDFLRLPIIAAVGLLVYGEPLSFWVLLGGAVIAAGNIINIAGERVGRRSA
jgi:drug/metabolite transporter (DMT)-like permease